MKIKSHFNVLYSEETIEFLKELPIKAKQKVLYNIEKCMNGYVDDELFKKLENSNIWEFRTFYNSIAYRLFSFWDINTNSLVIVTHGIIKKSQKTPKKEIEKAERLRLEYFKNQLNKINHEIL
ncbi:MAG: type II toxin-antitoxin system RelE/ParE family toxin [Paludibacteraceae bacterium]|nr:type II toxin-antitoxin system RelE/ParE family toxin [Paludibacteraceae bacterium]